MMKTMTKAQGQPKRGCLLRGMAGSHLRRSFTRKVTQKTPMRSRSANVATARTVCAAVEVRNFIHGAGALAHAYPHYPAFLPRRFGVGQAFICDGPLLTSLMSYTS